MVRLLKGNMKSKSRLRSVSLSLIISFILIGLAIPFSSQTTAKPVPGDPVKIDSGLIAGQPVSDNVKAYLGITYAAPPVGSQKPCRYYRFLFGGRNVLD